MLVRYCTAVALKRHERLNAFNLVDFCSVCDVDHNAAALIVIRSCNRSSRLHFRFMSFVHF